MEDGNQCCHLCYPYEKPDPDGEESDGAENKTTSKKQSSRKSKPSTSTSATWVKAFQAQFGGLREGEGDEEHGFAETSDQNA